MLADEYQKAKQQSDAVLGLAVGEGVGDLVATLNGLKAFKYATSTIEEPSKAVFGSVEKLEGHFTKHGGEFKGTYNTAEEYLQGARDVMQNGSKVQYKYKVTDPVTGQKVEELRTGYVRFMESSSKGVAKFEFVGTNKAGEITTYHVESGKDFWKMLNGSNTPVINVVE